MITTNPIQENICRAETITDYELEQLTIIIYRPYIQPMSKTYNNVQNTTPALSLSLSFSLSLSLSLPPFFLSICFKTETILE